MSVPDLVRQLLVMRLSVRTVAAADRPCVVLILAIAGAVLMLKRMLLVTSTPRVTTSPATPRHHRIP